MSFGRVPFQFTATDPAERHAELLKRFGVPKEGDMLVETQNPASMDGFCGPSSPRLQHRIPNFMAEGREPSSSENVAESVDSGKTAPRVRVIPIQVESRSSDKPSRQRTRSGGSIHNSRLISEDKAKSSSNSSLPVSPDPVVNQERELPINREASHAGVTSKPKVYNIPVFVEGRDNKGTPSKINHVTNIPVQRVSSPGKPNGPCISKSSSKATSKPREPEKSPVEISKEQISAVLKELDSYKEGVEKFSGVQGDKQYRYLDEMLTRCMLKLDDVETYGNEEVRKARKAAVREVEKYVSMLDSKIQTPAAEDVAMMEQSKSVVPDENASGIDSTEETREVDRGPEDLKESSSENMEIMDGVATDSTELKPCDSIVDNNESRPAASNELPEACEMELEEKSPEDTHDKVMSAVIDEPLECASGESAIGETVSQIDKNREEKDESEVMEIEPTGGNQQEQLQEKNGNDSKPGDVENGCGDQTSISNIVSGAVREQEVSQCTDN